MPTVWPMLPDGAIVGVFVGIEVAIGASVGVAVGAMVATAPATAIGWLQTELTAPELSVNTEVAVKLPPELYVWASCADTEAVPSPSETSCEAPSPKLNVALEIVPSVSLPVAVNVTDKGAEPDEVDVERLIQTGLLFVGWVGIAVGETDAVTLGDGDEDGETVVVTVGDGLLVSHVFGVIES